jgi:hypothetical protein
MINVKIIHSIGLFFSVARLAAERISPLVKKMEEESKFDPDALDALFKNGVSIYFFFILFF